MCTRRLPLVAHNPQNKATSRGGATLAQAGTLAPPIHKALFDHQLLIAPYLALGLSLAIGSVVKAAAYMKRWLIAAAVLTLVISGLVFTQATLEKPLLRLGVPGQWTWRYDHSPYADRALICLIGAGLLCGLCYSARQRASELAGRRLRLFLLMAILLTFCLQVSFAYLGRAGFGQAIFWTGFPGANSYLAEARRVNSLGELLAARQDPNRPFRMHVSVHPPGPVLSYFVLLRAWDTAPEKARTFAQFVEKAVPYARESRAILEENILKRSCSDSELATVYSSIFILWMLVALAVLPLYYWAASLFG